MSHWFLEFGLYFTCRMRGHQRGCEIRNGIFFTSVSEGNEIPFARQYSLHGSQGVGILHVVL
jgi:hypothetical protein